MDMGDSIGKWAIYTLKMHLSTIMLGGKLYMCV